MARPVGQTPYAARSRRRPWRTLLFLAFLIVPVLEIAAIIGVGKIIGGWPTVGLLLLMSFLGTWLMRHEGARTWRALNGALSSGTMPSRELADAALVLIGGTLLLAPGFLTDVVGLFCILPITRPITRRLLEGAVRARVLASAAGPLGAAFPQGYAAGPTDPATGPASRAGHTDAASQTVQGKVVER